jgi:hypothetical protein
LISRISLAVPVVLVSDTLPKAPNITFVIERFIARHINTERMKPEKAVQCARDDEHVVVDREARAVAARPA